MKIIDGDITNVTSGIICHQVNCLNRMGAGVAKAISDKWPEVKTDYHRYCRTMSKEELFGKVLFTPISNEDIIVASIFSQYNYGNSKKTGVVYTDVDKLIFGLCVVLDWYEYEDVYIPYGIGCGLAGADWNDVSKRIEDLDDGYQVIAVRKN